MHLSHRHDHILHLAAADGELTSAAVADELAVTRAHANTLLRRLEHAGLLHAELVGDGRLRYAPALARAHR
jgi:predicted ArsR family transcriptional regulator